MTKLFYEDSWNSRASKYVVRYTDGSTHSDGSDFFGAACFSNRPARDQFVWQLIQQGYALKTVWPKTEISVASSLTVEE